MKNSTLKNFAITCALSPLALIAQPTLTATGINPVVGDVIVTETAQYVAPGSAGASQTWNLAMTSQSSATTTGATPSSTPYGSTFPTSTVCFGTSPYVYYKTSATEWQTVGIVSPAPVVISYSNAEDMLRFPMAYNTNYTDAWSATFVSASYTYYRTGSTTVTADGWGTLTTPAGTFSNVMRVHFVQTYQDSTNIMSTPYVIQYNNDEYMWYLNGNHTPIAAVYDLTITPGSPIQGGFYISNVVSGIDDESAMTSLNVFPTLASENISFVYGVGQPSAVSITIYDAVGRAVKTVPQVQAYEGENTIVVSVADLPDGNYMAAITCGDALPVVRKFVVAK